MDWTHGYIGELATIVNSPIHHGSYGARFTTNGGGGTENAYVSKSIDMSEVYVRGYFRIDGGLRLSNNNDRFYLLRLAHGSTPLVYAGIRRSSGVDRWVIYVRNGSSYAPYTYATSVTPQMGQWYNVELHWKLGSGTSGLAELYVDGVKVIGVTEIILPPTVTRRLSTSGS